MRQCCHPRLGSHVLLLKPTNRLLENIDAFIQPKHVVYATFSSFLYYVVSWVIDIDNIQPFTSYLLAYFYLNWQLHEHCLTMPINSVLLIVNHGNVIGVRYQFRNHSNFSLRCSIYVFQLRLGLLEHAFCLLFGNRERAILHQGLIIR